MANNQPKIVPPKTPFQTALDLLSFLGLVGFIIFFLLYWPGLPEEVPQHFDSLGSPNGYGSKYTLMLLPLIALSNFFLFTYLNKRPYTFNYLTKITEENAAHQYTAAMNMMSAINAVVIYIFFYITWKVIATAEGKAAGLGPWFMPVFLILVFAPIVFYFIQAGRRPKA